MGTNIRINAVRETLRQHPDGLTIAQMTALVGSDKSHISRIINKFPDAYIDRWQKKGSHLTAVWCVVVPPENCPKPNRKTK